MRPSFNAILTHIFAFCSTQQILLDAEERDHLFTELQQNLQNRREPVTAVKHTL